jgi:hypothetical protein
MVRNVSVKNKFEKASDYYHHSEYRYNCAQAMVCHYGGSEDEISEMKAMGSGRAPNGYCGALQGALFLLGKHSFPKDAYIKTFAQQAGSPFCRQIRKQKQISCRQCVEIADKTLSSFLNNHSNHDK